MTPLEQIEELKAEKDQVDPYRMILIAATILGLVVMVGGAINPATFWVTWLIGVMLFTPNWIVTARDWHYNSRISAILKEEAEKAMEEKYGREETS